MSKDTSTPEELVLIQLKALPEDSPLKKALSAISAAAENWSEELVTYIAKGSEQYGQDEEAQGQRDAATEINAALALLRS